MTAQPLILLGGGGHALVIAEAARAAGFDPRGLYDDNPECPASTDPNPVPHLGPLAAARSVQPGCRWILALGDIAARRHLLADVPADPPPATITHPAAHVSPTARLGPGVFIAPAAVVHARAAIADHAIINTAAVVEHDCRVGANTHIAPRATLAGSVTVGDDTLVGLGAIILPGVRVGSRCTVGAGAVVLRDVPDATTVAGNPARPLP